MNYSDCNFDDLGSCARLYELSPKTARTWAGKSVMPVPWRDPWAVLEWYRVAYEREPGKRVRERVRILGPQMARWEEEQAAAAGGDDAAGMADRMAEVAAEVVTGEAMAGTLERREIFEEICGDLANARTLARIASEEREAYEHYRIKKDNGFDCSVERRTWQDLTKTKREWAKTPDAVELGFRVLKNWLRSEWELQWKELRMKLDGRRLGQELRAELLEVADDPVEWRRVWDMGMERVILSVLEE